MEPTFKEACVALKPYFDTFSKKFETDLKNGVFLNDADSFIRSKAQMELLGKMRQTIENESYDGDTTNGN